MSFYPFAASQAPVTGQSFTPTGLTGATAPSRYAGATTSGAPQSGTFALGDFVIDESGTIWVCTVAGSPGSWSDVAAARLPGDAADAGFLAWNYDPGPAATAGSAPTNNTILLIRVNVRAPLSCTSVSVFLTATGAGLNSGQNFTGLYNSAGNLVGTSADQTAAWGSTGVKTAALAGGPFALTAGFYWVALLPNETAGTVPSFMRTAADVSSSGANIGFTAATGRWATNTTGTSLPPSITPASNVLLSLPFWAALS